MTTLPIVHRRNEEKTCVVYVLACRDGSLYAGWTNDLASRMRAHDRGEGSRYVRSRRPFRLLAFWDVPDRSTALREEARFKRLTRGSKLRAIATGQVFERVLHNAPDVSEPAPAGGRSTAPPTAARDVMEEPDGNPNRTDRRRARRARPRS